MLTEAEVETKTFEAIEAATTYAAECAIRVRARDFALCPALLDSIEPGLSTKSPRRMRATIMGFIGDEMMKPRRDFSFGGFIPLINLNGALNYANQCVAIESREFAR